MGLLYDPTRDHGPAGTHASTPAALPMRDGTAVIWFSARDAGGRSHVHELVADLATCTVISGPSDSVLTPGRPGTFDDRGCSVGCVVAVVDGLWMYYIGWNTDGATFRNAIGLAVRGPREERFRRISEGPILDRSTANPYSLSYPFVAREPDGWRMWYGSHLSPVADPADMHHGIKEATSTDGASWQTSPEVVVAPVGEEVATVRPWVGVHEGARTMWFASRAARYQLEAAVLDGDGNWRRRADTGLPAPGHAAFAREEVTYPSVVDVPSGRYLLYNGDSYGRTGIGVARWQA